MFGPGSITTSITNIRCRSCNTLLDFQLATGKTKSIAIPKAVASIPVLETVTPSKEELLYGKVDPPDVEKLGTSSWTLLHLIAATYPEHPDTKEQSDMKQFVSLFGKFYPCWFCAEDFREYIKKNEPDTSSQDKFGTWLCNAHNEVNVKLGKEKFNCDLWKKRWRDGWDE